MFNKLAVVVPDLGERRAVVKWKSIFTFLVSAL
jgi:hypothetical protein